MNTCLKGDTFFYLPNYQSMLHKEVTDVIIKSFYKVYNTLGYGFLEKVYENALVVELKQAGLQCLQQHPVKVYYKGEAVGLYFTDLLVENRVVLELKTVETLHKDHEYQLINYLRATELEVGILFNFGKDPQFVRKIFTNDRKSWYVENM